MNKDNFRDELIKMGVTFNDETASKLETYASFLLEYNAHTNLTAIKTEEEVYLKHFYDSLTLIKEIDLNQENSLLDIGSGAGFPGMVLKIFYPHLEVVLIDSNNKKTKFLESLAQKLDLNGINIINDRIENITPKYLNYFDVVTARAVTNMQILTELAMPLVKENKYFIAMKGSNEEEIANSANAIEKMHGKIININKFELPYQAGGRMLIKVQKISKTNTTELRSYEKIKKRPL